jgi:hypothetical protein
MNPTKNGGELRYSGRIGKSEMIFLNTTLIEQLSIPFRNLENYIWRVFMVALMQLTIIPLVNVNDKYYVYCHIVYYITSLLSY